MSSNFGESHKFLMANSALEPPSQPPPAYRSPPRHAPPPYQSPHQRKKRRIASLDRQRDSPRHHGAPPMRLAAAPNKRRAAVADRQKQAQKADVSQHLAQSPKRKRDSAKPPLEDEPHEGPPRFKRPRNAAHPQKKGQPNAKERGDPPLALPTDEYGRTKYTAEQAWRLRKAASMHNHSLAPLTRSQHLNITIHEIIRKFPTPKRWEKHGVPSKYRAPQANDLEPFVFGDNGIKRPSSRATSQGSAPQKRPERVKSSPRIDLDDFLAEMSAAQK